MSRMTILNLLALIVFAVIFGIAVSNKNNTVGLVNDLSNGFFLGPLKVAASQ